MADVLPDATPDAIPPKPDPVLAEPLQVEPAPVEGPPDEASEHPEVSMIEPEIPATPEPVPAETTSPVEPPALLDPAPQAEQTPSPAQVQPELEASTSVPPLATSATGDGTAEEGGEWELLLAKVQAWLASGQLQALWSQARTPITLVLAAAALLLVLRVYTGLLAAIESLPLVPGLLELVGLIWALRFGLPQLAQRSRREQLLNDLNQRWQRFRGRS